MTRKQFLQSAAALMATGLFAACSDDSDGPAAAGPSDSTPDASPGVDAGNGSHDAGRDGEIGADGGGIKDASDDAPSKSCLDNGTNTAISGNHGHVLTVSKEDVTAATDKTYSILGSADHSHDVTITAAQFAELAQNQSITVVSTETNMHMHTITVNCA